MVFATIAAFFARGRLHALRRVEKASAIALCSEASTDCAISYFPIGMFDGRQSDACLPCGIALRGRR